MKLNKKIPALLLVTIAALGLSSCDTIQANPSNVNDKIVENNDLVNNIEKLIFKQLHDSSNYGSDVTNLVFHKIFEQRFGSFAELNAASSKTDTDIAAFVDAHTGYQVLNSDGKRVTTEDAKKSEKANLQRVAKQMNKAIATALWKAIDNSSYKIDNLFNEKLFAMSLYSDLYDLNMGSKTFATLDFYGNDAGVDTGILFTPDMHLWDETTDSWNANQEILHLGTKDGQANYYDDYITRHLLPTIEQTILTEQYLYTQSYSSFGRKYGRDIDYIAIPSLSPAAGQVSTWGDTGKLCLEFAKNLKDEDSTNDDFEILADAYRGIDIGDGLWKKAETLLASAGFTKVKLNAADVEALTTDQEKTNYNAIQPYYYLGTVYGNNLFDFARIKNKPSDETKSIETSYSSSGTYSYFHGYELKVRENKLVDYTKQGWSIKSSSTFSLPDTITSRLYNINVAVDLDDATDSKYLQKVESAGKFLLPDDTTRDNQYPYLWNVSSTYYFVRVNEASSTTKLSKSESTTGSYTNNDKYGAIYNDNVAYEIASLLSSDATNKNNALEYILENSDILYHDQDIYDYFKKTYPALFED